MLDVQKLSSGQGHKSSPMGISHSRSKDPRVQKIFENKSARISQTHNHHHNHNKKQQQELAAMRAALDILGSRLFSRRKYISAMDLEQGRVDVCAEQDLLFNLQSTFN